ncbi:MAG: glycosyltransferase family 32 protein [Microthrixaceae bacterium]
MSIPKILFRTVPEETSAEVERWWDGFRRLHPGWETITYREPIDPEAWPTVGPLLASCETGAHRAGLLRLEGLVTHGGFYVDSDVEPLRPFDPLLGLSAVAAWEDETTIPDAVLGSEPGHPAMVEALRRAVLYTKGGRGTYGAGTGMTTEVFSQRDDVTLLPPGAFYPYHYLEKRRRPQVTRESTPWAYCAHHWHHSWGSEESKRSIAARQR